MMRLLKLLPEATSTSRYTPDAEKVGLPTGSEPYWEPVSDPSPLAQTVVPSLVALQVPDDLAAEQLCQLVAPDGGAGGGGGPVPPPPPVVAWPTEKVWGTPSAAV